MMPLVRGENVAWRDEFYYEYPFYKWDIKLPRCEGVWTRRWKYARYFTPEESCEQLFDLESDPWEMHDRADDPAHAETLREARERLQVLREQASYCCLR